MKKILSLTMAATMIMGSTLPVFAATEHNTDSVGSVAEDITNETKVGQDVVQNQQSEYTDEITKDQSENTCNAYLTKASTFSVIIPKTIVLDGSAENNNEGIYTVSVKGNIAGDDVISVTPDAGFDFKQPGKKNVAAVVTQPTTTFQINDDLVTEENILTGISTTGKVSVDHITSGSWEGNFNFKISLDTTTAITK